MKVLEPLSNFQIDERYKGIKEYGGTFSKDLLPKLENKAYIINMQDSTAGNGSHWTAVININPKETVYFDSFGQDDAALEVEKFMKPTKKASFVVLLIYRA